MKGKRESGKGDGEMQNGEVWNVSNIHHINIDRGLSAYLLQSPKREDPRKGDMWGMLLKHVTPKTTHTTSISTPPKGDRGRFPGCLHPFFF